MIRYISFFCALTCALFLASGASAAMVDLSLDLEFNDPADTNSGGTWTLVGEADERGISAVVVQLSPVNFNDDFLIPDTVFDVAVSQTVGLILELVNGSGLASPVFDVGVIGGSYSPTYTEPAGILPLGSNPDLGTFSGGVAIATGTFDANDIPAFVPNPALNADPAVANVFPTAGGNPIAATVRTTVRSVPIPEPTTLALLGMSLLGLATTTRRR